ncbi:MAG: hypothetical protein R3E48_23145 [Burkholderiaceae bacterium]
MKKRLREMAEELIKVAAIRQLKSAPELSLPHGAWEEFVARFPYEETDDQMASIEAVVADLAAGRPMQTVWSAATSASARPRRPCARLSSQR